MRQLVVASVLTHCSCAVHTSPPQAIRAQMWSVLTHCGFPVHTSPLQAIRALRPLLDENVLIRTADSLGDIIEVRVRGYGGGTGTGHDSRCSGDILDHELTTAGLPSPIPFLACSPHSMELLVLGQRNGLIPLCPLSQLTLPSFQIPPSRQGLYGIQARISQPRQLYRRPVCVVIHPPHPPTLHHRACTASRPASLSPGNATGGRCASSWRPPIPSPAPSSASLSATSRRPAAAGTWTYCCSSCTASGGTTASSSSTCPGPGRTRAGRRAAASSAGSAGTGRMRKGLTVGVGDEGGGWAAASSAG